MEKIKEKEKAKSKEEALQMRKLAVSNHKAQISIFKALLLYLLTANDLHLCQIKNIFAFFPISSSSTTPVVTAYLACQIDFQAKKSVSELMT